MGGAWHKHDSRIVSHDNMVQHACTNKEVKLGLSWGNADDDQIIKLPVKCSSKLKTSWDHCWIGEMVTVMERIEGKDVAIEHKQFIAIYTVRIKAHVQRVQKQRRGRVYINIEFDDSDSEHSDSSVPSGHVPQCKKNKQQ